MIWRWAAVALAMGVLDFFYTLWTVAVQRNRALCSAVYSALIVLCGAFVTVEYTTEHVLAIPAAIGAAVGTWIALKTVKSPSSP